MAYAAVVSLVEILKQILDSDRFSDIHYPKPQIESLYGKLCSLRSSLETIFPAPKSVWSSVNDLEAQIRDVIYKAQDTIESFISDQSLSSESEKINPVDQSRRSTSLFWEDIIANIDPITEKAHKIAGSISDDGQRGDSSCDYILPSKISTYKNTEIVGQNEYLELLVDLILKETPKLQAVSIIGMPGIGKTTLARTIYDDTRIYRHFNTRAWVTVSPEYRVAEILGKLSDSIEIKGQKVGSQLIQGSAEELAINIHQILFNNRYLIVVDDMWDNSVWDEIRKSLPDNMNGSRIVLTTTIARLAQLASPSANILKIGFLNEDESWKLLRLTVFGPGKPCHHQIEKIGRRIAKNCEGLPLAIIKVGKALCKIETTVENWTRVAENENPLIITRNDDTHISKRLSLCYQQLPQHLKACFLYMGIFPKNYEIPTSKLFKLWVSEGFLEPKASKSLEEMAQDCLDELVSRSLVLVGEQMSRGRITKTCRIHFVFRNLCVNEAEYENFFHVIKKYPESFPQGINYHRRLCIHNNTVLGFPQVHSWMESVSAARSLLCFGPKHQRPLSVYLYFRLLRVLDALTIRFYYFPHQATELVHLRYLAITYDGKIIPGSISRLLNLEVLIVHRHHIIVSSDAPVYLPIGIWKLHKLRHLQCMGFDLPDPGEDDYVILNTLLTLSGVSAHSCTTRVLARMPNLMKLGIRIESPHDQAVETFTFFGDVTNICGRIESLKCIVVMHPGFGSGVVSLIPAFPTNLRKITLSGCGFCWEYMKAIAALPNLEILKLQSYAFRGLEWETCDGEFLRLEFLLIEDLDLEKWTTDSDHFPSLKHLIIRHCYKLQEIPRELGDIPTLQMMEVHDCSPSATDSARKIEMEQLVDWGNDYLQFRIHASWD